METVNPIISAEQIDARLTEIGAQITADYQGKTVLMVGVLNGAFIVMADLARKVALPVDCEFMSVSSYRNATVSSGRVQIIKDLDQDITGREVLIVEDVLDTGLTLDYLKRSLSIRDPASIEIASLLVKKDFQKIPIECKYVGFEVGPEWVVGYGLDVGGRYRNLPYIGSYHSDDTN